MLTHQEQFVRMLDDARIKREVASDGDGEVQILTTHTITQIHGEHNVEVGLIVTHTFLRGNLQRIHVEESF